MKIFHSLQSPGVPSTGLSWLVWVILLEGTEARETAPGPSRWLVDPRSKPPTCAAALTLRSYLGFVTPPI